MASGWFSYDVSADDSSVDPRPATLDHTFHCLATASLSGSSGLGAPSRACMLSSIVLICNAGDQLFLSTSKHIRPRRSMLGW